MSRKNTDVDKINQHLGNQVKLLRLANGYSRQQLCDMIGVSNQQLAKYETGFNRLSVGRLVLIAKALSVNLSYFYQEIDKLNPDPIVTQHQRMCIEVARNFMQIEKSEHKTAVNDLIKTLSKAA